MSSSLPSNRPPKDDVQDDSRSVAEESELSNEEGWEDVEPEEDDSQPIVDLFSDKVYPDVLSMLKECKEKRNFDLWKLQKDLGV